MVESFVSVIHAVVALFMILVVLIQGGNQGGAGAALGGGNSSGVFGATGGQTVLGKITYVAAGVFMVTSVWLTILQGASGDAGLSDKIKQRVEQSEGAGATTPANEDSSDKK